jgi:hypothetical protein
MLRRLLPFGMLLWASAASGADLPAAIGVQIPHGYDVLAWNTGKLEGGPGDDYVVVLARQDDDQAAPAPARPLLLFHGSGTTYRLVDRNDYVVLHRDDGGQCDPFDPEDGLAVKGAYFTVQNQVACGSHWSDFITFRFDPHDKRFVFSSEIFHSWKFNSSGDPDAEAIVPDGQPTVLRADPRKPVSFDAWRPEPAP